MTSHYSYSKKVGFLTRRRWGACPNHVTQSVLCPCLIDTIAFANRVCPWLTTHKFSKVEFEIRLIVNTFQTPLRTKYSLLRANLKRSSSANRHYSCFDGEFVKIETQIPPSFFPQSRRGPETDDVVFVRSARAPSLSPFPIISRGLETMREHAKSREGRR